MSKRNGQTDREIVDTFVNLLSYCYQMRFPGYDTWITRKNVSQHLFDMSKELIEIDGKIDAISKIANGE